MSHIHMRDARAFASEVLNLVDSVGTSGQSRSHLTEAIAERVCNKLWQSVETAGGDGRIENKVAESPQKELDPRNDRAIVADGVGVFLVMAEFLVNRKGFDHKDETSDYLLSTIGARFASMVNSRSLDQDERRAAESLQGIAFAAIEIARRCDGRQILRGLLSMEELKNESCNDAVFLRRSLERVGLTQ